MPSAGTFVLSSLADWLDPPEVDTDQLSDDELARLEADPLVWLRELFPDYFPTDFAEHHAAFWRWIWAIRPGHRPDPFVAVWARGGAKSTSAEASCVAIGARGRRRYGLYVCETQEQGDDHVANIGAMLESRRFGEAYPQMAARMVGKYGNSKGWRRNRLRTNAGFTIDALGLDSAARGAKLEDARPDFLVIDDVDSEHDSGPIVAKKIKTLTKRILPAGSTDLAVLAIQNLVHPDSIFSQLVDGRADFLANRTVSGPVPALRGMAVEQRAGRYVIVAGEPTWAGQGLATCQAQVDDWGLTAFRSEAQHDVEAPPGGMFDHLDFQHCQWADVPELVRTIVWVDPAVTNKDSSDSHGIQADGISEDGRIFRLFSWEGRTSPVDSLRRAIAKAYELGAEHVGVETDQGGDAWQSVYREALARVLSDNPDLMDEPVPQFTWDKAGAGHGPKTHRASKMLADYEHGLIVHVIGTHEVLERALRRFPTTKPLDLVDCAYWSWHDLAEPAVESFEYEQRVSISPY